MDENLSPAPPDPINFGALDPTADASFDARIAAIVHDAAIPARADLLTQVSGWVRPALAAAAVIAALSAIPLLSRSAPAPSPAATGASAAEILGIPAPVARIARAQRGAPVDVADLAEAFGVEPTHAR